MAMTKPTSEQVTFLQTGTGATARTVDAKLKDTISVKDFGAVSNASTDNTAAVQLAINSIGIYGGVVYIEDGCYFYLKLLTFPNEFCDLSYRITDNRDTQVVTSRKGTNERVIFTVNSGYPADASGGLVGEQIFSSPLHPGMVLNARPDINTATVLSKLGTGQNLNDPIRASYRIESENISKFQMELQEFSTSGNTYSGMYFNGMYYSIVLSGVSSTSWSIPPAQYSIVTGSISGAKGFILSNTTNTTIHWFYGAFQVGDYLVSSAPTSPTTSTTAITAVSASTLVSLQPLTNSTQTGNWCVGLRPTDPTQDHLFAVGGKIAAAQSVSYGQLLTTVTNPAFVLIDNYHTSNNGFEITYNTTPTVAQRRVTLRKLGVATDVAHIGAVFAHASFTVAYGCSNSSYNITKLMGGFSQIAVGHYRLTFINAAAYAGYCVSVAVSDPMQYAYVFSVQTTYVDIKVVTTGTTTLVALTGSCHVSCMGGDVAL